MKRLTDESRGRTDTDALLYTPTASIRFRRLKNVPRPSMLLCITHNSKRSVAVQTQVPEPRQHTAACRPAGPDCQQFSGRRLLRPLRHVHRSQSFGKVAAANKDCRK